MRRQLSGAFGEEDIPPCEHVCFSASSRVFGAVCDSRIFIWKHLPYATEPSTAVITIKNFRAGGPIWDGRCIRYNSEIQHLAISDGPPYVAVATSKRRLLFFSCSRELLVSEALLGSHAKHLRFGPPAEERSGGQEVLATICEGGELVFWQVGLWNRVWSRLFHANVTAIAFCPAARVPYVAVATEMPSVTIMRTNPWEVRGLESSVKIR